MIKGKFSLAEVMQLNRAPWYIDTNSLAVENTAIVTNSPATSVEDKYR